MAEKKTEDKVEITQVPVQMGLAYKLTDGRTINTDEAILELLNDVKDIKKAVA